MFRCVKGEVLVFNKIGVKSAEKFSYGFKNFVNLGVEIINFKITPVGRFSIFHAKLQVFAGLGALFGNFFGTFLSFVQAKLEFLAGLGGLFE